VKQWCPAGTDRLCPPIHSSSRRTPLSRTFRLLPARGVAEGRGTRHSAGRQRHIEDMGYFCPVIVRKLMPPFAALRAFEAVGRLGGVRKASRELGIDHAVVSRHVRTLEAWLGRSLLTRDGAGDFLTEAGQDYHEDICQALTLIGAATASLMNVGERLKLSVWCIPGFGFLWLSDRINDFISENPDIDLDFKPSDVSPDFRAHEGDVDIRYLRSWQEAPMAKGLQILELARPNVFPVASPAFIAQMEPIRSPSDLLKYTLLHEDNDLEWVRWLEAQAVTCEDRLPGPRLWHAHLTLNAARQGHGIALANSMLLG
jgi:LysR family transcriptional regulator, glycine cleavage system transcriptional activator